MKHSLIIIFILSVLGCDDVDVQLVKENKVQKNIESLCVSLQSGMTLSEANKIMDGVSPFKMTRTSGSNSGSGYYLYWNSPTDAEDVMNEPIRVVIPHGETCRASFNSSQVIEDVNFVFVSEQEYQEKASRMSE